MCTPSSVEHKSILQKVSKVKYKVSIHIRIQRNDTLASAVDPTTVSQISATVLQIVVNLGTSLDHFSA